MACADPGTRSPGHLVLVYNDLTNGEIHKCSSRFLVGIDLGNTAVLQAEADAWAGNVQHCIINNLQLTEWQAKNAAGVVVNGGPLTGAPLVGTHGINVNAQKWLSQTVDFEGKGRSVPPFCHGPSRFRIFIQGALIFTRGMKYFSAATDASYLGLKNFMNASTVIGADYYGQKANFVDNLPVQFNASAQRRVGT